MEVNDASSRMLAGLLEARTGQQLTMSRRWRIETALGGLMRERGIETLDQLIANMLAAREPELADEVVDALLNNETFFFRDRPAFDQLLGPALMRIARARNKQKAISIWCAGCSTGQEAYSLAISFAEARLRWQDWKIEILGTDVSRSAVARAREGVYSQFEVQRGLPVLQMMRWFQEEQGAQWRLADEIRSGVRFQVHNLTEAPPGRFDIVLCRNVLLYLSPEVRRQVFDRLADAVAPDGLLMLGAGETLLGQTSRFVTDSECRGLYVRSPEPRSSARAAVG